MISFSVAMFIETIYEYIHTISAAQLLNEKFEIMYVLYRYIAVGRGNVNCGKNNYRVS